MMDIAAFFAAETEKHSVALAALRDQTAGSFAKLAETCIQSLRNGGKILLFGNGGSAADAQHLAAEFAGRYLVDRPGLPAVALTTNSSAVTAIGNDYGYADVFARQLEGLGSPGDVLVAITTSGGSESVRRAVRAAGALGMTTIGMTGAKGAAFAASCDIALVSPHASTPHIQEGHITMGHAFCLLVEQAMFGAGTMAGGPRRRPRAKRGGAPRAAAAKPAKRAKGGRR